MRYTKDGLSVNKTEREAQLSHGVKEIMAQGGIIEPPESPKPRCEVCGKLSDNPIHYEPLKRN